MATGVPQARARLGVRRLKQAQQENAAGYLFISPWLVGFFVFTAGPMAISLGLSLLKTDLLRPSTFVGLDNFVALVDDELFWKSLRNTAYYSLFSVALGMLASLALAFVMNVRLSGIRLFRTIYYLPAVLPSAPVAILWRQIFNPERGLANYLLDLLNLPPQKWIYSERLALPCLIAMSLWGIGSSLMIYLAGLQGIPTDLYEAAQIDGAGWWPKLRRVTLPMLSPTIFFNLIMSIIGSFMVFTASYVMTQGGPNNATLTYVLYLYNSAFRYFKFGYASALAWVLFFVVLGLTALVFRSSPMWVYYESELR
ncbi:MAG: sugar ABC transporter permease [Anaerolineae bacterium]|nr:sugar ABC transporter permease [Anaerolineae bacterium]